MKQAVYKAHISLNDGKKKVSKYNSLKYRLVQVPLSCIPACMSSLTFPYLYWSYLFSSLLNYNYTKTALTPGSSPNAIQYIWTIYFQSVIGFVQQLEITSIANNSRLTTCNLYFSGPIEMFLLKHFVLLHF